MTDPSRSHFALNKLILAGVNYCTKKGNWVHSQNLIQGFPTRSLLNRYWRRVLCSGLNRKWEPDKKQTTKLTSYCAPFCFFENLSQRSGSPGITITLVFTENTFMCFMVKDRQSLLLIPLQIPSDSYRFQKAFQICCPFLFIWIQVNIYTKAALSWEKINRHIYMTRTIAYLLNLIPDHMALHH